MITNFKIFENKDKGKDVLYTLKTKAIHYINVGRFYDKSTSIGRQYNVNVIYDGEFSDTGYNAILSIETTPGSWYIKTLEDNGALDFDRISIQGDNWYCDNWKDVCDELKEDVLPILDTLIETMVDSKRYNI